MKNRRLFWGIILLFVGVIASLASMDVFQFSWLAIRKLWPFLFIIIGVLILPLNDTIKVILLALTLGLGCLAYHFEAKKSHNFHDIFSSADIRRQKPVNDQSTYNMPVLSEQVFFGH